MVKNSLVRVWVPCRGPLAVEGRGLQADSAWVERVLRALDLLRPVRVYKYLSAIVWPQALEATRLFHESALAAQ